MSLSVCALLGDSGPVARRLEGFEVRPQQVEMAAAVERTLEARGRLVVEAGTGVGKSFAYLAPVIRRIVENEERVVVSTNTINLQEQLIEKDIPLLAALRGRRRPPRPPRDPGLGLRDPRRLALDAAPAAPPRGLGLRAIGHPQLHGPPLSDP
ncbi:MAG: DEAD/DEAH box helicase [Planctomycetota bacterium]|jgi:Rad3-related DNA helicase